MIGIILLVLLGGGLLVAAVAALHARCSRAGRQARITRERVLVEQQIRCATHNAMMAMREEARRAHHEQRY